MIDKKSKNILTGFFILFGVLIISIVLFDDHNKSSDMQSVHNNLNDLELNGHVSNISQNRGTITMRLLEKQGNPIYFSTSRNYDLRPYDIDEFIQIGDSLSKKKYSMRLDIYREEEHFFFILDKTINSKN